MASNIDAMKEAYEAFGKGDTEKAAEVFTEDAVWQGTDSTELPGGGEHRGRDAVLDTMGTIGSQWDSFDLSPDEFFENGDSVVMLGHADVKKGDNSGQVPIVHVARFDGDGKVERFQVLTDTLLSAQLLGLIGGKPPEGDRQETQDDDSGSDEDSGDDD